MTISSPSRESIPRDTQITFNDFAHSYNKFKKYSMLIQTAGTEDMFKATEKASRHFQQINSFMHINLKEHNNFHGDECQTPECKIYSQIWFNCGLIQTRNEKIAKKYFKSPEGVKAQGLYIKKIAVEKWNEKKTQFNAIKEKIRSSCSNKNIKLSKLYLSKLEKLKKKNNSTLSGEAVELKYKKIKEPIELERKQITARYKKIITQLDTLFNSAEKQVRKIISVCDDMIEGRITTEKEAKRMIKSLEKKVNQLGEKISELVDA
ncbi:MAG: hypothetical protein K2P51_02205 [Rhabdochlamydiaceae bacterium]|nr:hypothetical protein [Rhabdochlamydiaceae bacterium]